MYKWHNDIWQEYGEESGTVRREDKRRDYAVSGGRGDSEYKTSSPVHICTVSESSNTIDREEVQKMSSNNIDREEVQKIVFYKY